MSTYVDRFGKVYISGGVLSSPIIGIAPFIRPTIDNSFIKLRSHLNPNDDPELHESVINHFYKHKLNMWFETSQSYGKLLRYIKMANGTPTIISTPSELESNTSTSNNREKINFILDRIFSKYDLEALLTKLSFEYSINWYDMKNKHNDLIKEAIYKKIKNRLTRHL